MVSNGKRARETVIILKSLLRGFITLKLIERILIPFFPPDHQVKISKCILRKKKFICCTTLFPLLESSIHPSSNP